MLVLTGEVGCIGMQRSGISTIMEGDEKHREGRG
jgi:hypothetical protein